MVLAINPCLCIVLGSFNGYWLFSMCIVFLPASEYRIAYPVLLSIRKQHPTMNSGHYFRQGHGNRNQFMWACSWCQVYLGGYRKKRRCYQYIYKMAILCDCCTYYLELELISIACLINIVFFFRNAQGRKNFTIFFLHF